MLLRRNYLVRMNSSSSTAGMEKSSLQDMFTMGDEQEDGQMFDELMQQLGRIESQSEGKQNLNMLMEQFMMSEGMLDGSGEDDNEDEADMSNSLDTKPPAGRIVDIGKEEINTDITTSVV